MPRMKSRGICESQDRTRFRLKTTVAAKTLRRNYIVIMFASPDRRGHHQDALMTLAYICSAWSLIMEASLVSGPCDLQLLML